MSILKPGALEKLKETYLTSDPESQHLLELRISGALTAAMLLSLEQSKLFIDKIFTEYRDLAKTSLKAVFMYSAFFITKDLPSFRYLLSKINDSGVFNPAELEQFKARDGKDLVACAAYSNSFENIQLLIQLGYPLNNNFKGIAPILASMIHQDHKVFNMLISTAGIDLNVTAPPATLTPLDIANLYGYKYCAKELEKKNARCEHRTAKAGLPNFKEGLDKRFIEITSIKPDNDSVELAGFHILNGIFSNDQDFLAKEIGIAMKIYHAQFRLISSDQVKLAQEAPNTRELVRISLVTSLHVAPLSSVLVECFRDPFDISSILLKYTALHDNAPMVSLYLLLAAHNDKKIGEYIDLALAVSKKEGVSPIVKARAYYEAGKYWINSCPDRGKEALINAANLGMKDAVLMLWIHNLQYSPSQNVYSDEAIANLEQWREFVKLFTVIHYPNKFQRLLQSSQFAPVGFNPKCDSALEEKIIVTINATKALLLGDIDGALSFRKPYSHVDDITEFTELMILYQHLQGANSYIAESYKGKSDKDLPLQLKYQKIFIYSQLGKWSDARSLWKQVKDSDHSPAPYNQTTLNHWKQEIAEILLNNYLNEGLYAKALELVNYVYLDKESRDYLASSIDKLRAIPQPATKEEVEDTVGDLTLNEPHAEQQPQVTSVTPHEKSKIHILLPRDVLNFIETIIESASWGFAQVKKIYFGMMNFFHSESFAKAIPENDQLDCVVEGEHYTSQDKDVYPVSSAFYPNHYITIKRAAGFDGKVAEAATKAIKSGKVVFGLGHSGIKQFGDVIEAKNSSDEHLFTQRKYFDPKTGAYLIVLDQCGNHEKIARKVDLNSKPKIIGLVPEAHEDTAALPLDAQIVARDDAFLDEAQKYYETSIQVNLGGEYAVDWV